MFKGLKNNNQHIQNIIELNSNENGERTPNTENIKNMDNNELAARAFVDQASQIEALNKKITLLTTERTSLANTTNHQPNMPQHHDSWRNMRPAPGR